MAKVTVISKWLDTGEFNQALAGSTFDKLRKTAATLWEEMNDGNENESSIESHRISERIS